MRLSQTSSAGKFWLAGMQECPLPFLARIATSPSAWNRIVFSGFHFLISRVNTKTVNPLHIHSAKRFIADTSSCKEGHSWGFIGEIPLQLKKLFNTKYIQSNYFF